MTGARFDWAGLMRAGIGGHKLRPAEFWALTPVELMLILGIEGGAVPMDRARLEQLARSFPDRGAQEERMNGADRR